MENKPMLKKSDFLKEYQEVKDAKLDCIILYIHLPSGTSECLVNPCVEEKVKYIIDTYDDDLRHKNDSNVWIESYMICEESDVMTFGSAIDMAKDGCKIARKGWNGKNQYIELASAISYKNAEGEVVNCDHEAIGNQAFAFVGTSGVQMGWLASQADMLAEDWYVVE